MVATSSRRRANGEVHTYPGAVSPRRAAKLTDEQRDFAEQYLWLCDLKAKRFAAKCPYIDKEEFYQVAFEGLADAVKGFDPGEGVKFETWADRRIIGACLDMMRASGTIRTPRSRRKDPHRCVSIHSRFGRYNDAVIADEICIGGDGYTPVLDSTPPPGMEMESDDCFEAWLRGLTAVEKFVMRSYYGAVPMTMKQIGYHVDLSESRVSQMHDAILERLRYVATFPRYLELATA